MGIRTITSPIVFCSLLLISGIIVGMLGLGTLTPDEKAELISYLEVFMRGLSNPGLEPSLIFKLSLVHNLKNMVMIWAFGLAIIGVPLTCVMIFIRGFVLGFSSTLVTREIVSGGFLVFASGILPHNLIILPVLVISSSISISFSIMLLKQRPWIHGNLIKLALTYTLRFAAVSLLLVIASLTEAYLTPLLLKAATDYL